MTVQEFLESNFFEKDGNGNYIYTSVNNQHHCRIDIMLDEYANEKVKEYQEKQKKQYDLLTKPCNIKGCANSVCITI